MSNFYNIIETVLKHEGGFVDHPNDPGGATNHGISLRYLQQRGDLLGDIDGDGDIDHNDIRAMTRENAIDIYKIGFWDKYKLEDLHHGSVQEKIFDMVVNMGARQAYKLAQRAAVYLGQNIVVDGIVGPNTLKAINECEPKYFLQELRYRQAEFYLDLVNNNTKFKPFRDGWLRRACM